jgi:hypothetical protein
MKACGGCPLPYPPIPTPVNQLVLVAPFPLGLWSHRVSRKFWLWGKYPLASSTKLWAPAEHPPAHVWCGHPPCRTNLEAASLTQPPLYLSDQLEFTLGTDPHP